MNENKSSIRRAEQKDKIEIYELICLLEDIRIPPDLFDPIFEKNLADSSIFYFVSEHDLKITGFMSLHIQHLLHHWGKVAEIQELCVQTDDRNKGTGKMLLETAIKTAKENGCELIELAANNKRTKAHGFYSKNGFNNSHFKFTLPLK